MANNCCKYFTVSLVPIAALILAVVFGCAVVALPVLWIQLAAKTVYGVVIDAGSAHTDIYIYSWQLPFINGTGLVTERFNWSINVSLNDFTSDPSAVNETIIECLQHTYNFSISKMPNDTALRRNTTLILGATAGMRLVRDNNSNISDAIMAVVTNTLNHSEYNLTSATIISGREEAASGWVTTNYNYKMKMNPFAEPTNGSLDLGGASVEIAFEPHSETIHHPAEYMSYEMLFGKNYSLYARSYLCYGHNEAQSRFLASLVQTYDSHRDIPNPCMPEGMMVNLSRNTVFSLCVTSETAVDVFGYEIPLPSTLEEAEDNETISFVGTGNYTQCKTAIQEVFNFAACNISSTCINDSYSQPPVEGHFVGFSGFWYTASFFNVTHQKFTNGDEGWEAYEKAVADFCTLNQTEADAEYPKNSHLFHRCFDGTFILHLLQEGFGFTHNTNRTWSVTFQSQVHNTTMGWTMGYLLSQTLPQIPYHTRHPYGLVDLIVGMCVLAILCVVFVAFFVLTFYACRKVIRTRSGYTDIA